MLLNLIDDTFKLWRLARHVTAGQAGAKKNSPKRGEMIRAIDGSQHDRRDSRHTYGLSRRIPQKRSNFGQKLLTKKHGV